MDVTHPSIQTSLLLPSKISSLRSGPPDMEPRHPGVLVIRPHCSLAINGAVAAAGDLHVQQWERGDTSVAPSQQLSSTHRHSSLYQNIPKSSNSLHHSWGVAWIRWVRLETGPPAALCWASPFPPDLFCHDVADFASLFGHWTDEGQKGKGNESTQRAFSTFRDFLTFLTFRDFLTFRLFEILDTSHMPCPSTKLKSSRIDPNVAFAPTDIGMARLLFSRHLQPCQSESASSRNVFKKRDARQKDPASPGTLWRVTLFIISCLFVHFSTFRDFSTFCKKFGEQVDPAHTFSNHSQFWI